MIVIHDSSKFPQLSQVNPLRGLTMSRVVMLLDRAQYGFYSNLAWLYAYVERRETTMIALKSRRQAALGRCDWVIEAHGKQASDEANKSVVEAQKAFLESVYSQIDNLEDAWKWLGMATFRGFAHLEKHYDSTGTVTHLEPVPQWYMARRYPSKQWLYDALALDRGNGTPIQPDEWIVREVEGSLDEVASIFYCWKTMCLKDWGAFTSRFGVPNIFAEMEKDVAVPAGTTMDAFRDTIAQVVSNGSGALPPGVRANMLAGGSSDNTPFPVHLEYLDKSLVLAGTGGKLTMLSDSTGIGSGATSAHEDVFDDIASAELSEIAEIIDRSIGQPLLRMRFPNDRQMVKLAIRKESATDAEKVGDLMWKSKLGGYRFAQEAAEKGLGVKLERILTPDEVAVQNMDPNALQDQQSIEAQNRRNAITVNRDTLAGTIQLIEESVRQSVAEIANDFAHALALENGERDQALKTLENRLPKILEELNSEPVAAEAFEKIMAESLVEGLASQ